MRIPLDRNEETMDPAPLDVTPEELDGHLVGLVLIPSDECPDQRIFCRTGLATWDGIELNVRWRNRVPFAVTLALLRRARRVAPENRAEVSGAEFVIPLVV